MTSSLTMVPATAATETVTEENIQTNTDGQKIVTLDTLLEQYGENQIRNIAHGGLQDSNTRNFIVDVTKLLASVYDNLRNGMSEEELVTYTDMVSQISTKFKDNPELVQDILNWRKSRIELIEVANSSAKTLDQHLFIVNVARMVGSAVEILNSLNLGIYQKLCSIITSYAYNTSPKIGLVTECALELAPHLRYMGFVSSFLEILRSQVLFNRVVEAMKKDKNLFKPLKEWFNESEEFQQSVKKLFPYGIDKEIIESVEGTLENLGKEETIFAATILTNLKKDPMIYKDGKFWAKVFLFCRSDAAKQCYKRMVTGACPSDLECDLLYFRNELQQLEGTHIDSGSKLEIEKRTVEQIESSVNSNTRSFLGRIILCGMSSASLYYCYHNIMAGSKHKYSDRLRDLSANAQSFYNKMENIRL